MAKINCQISCHIGVAYTIEYAFLFCPVIMLLKANCSIRQKILLYYPHKQLHLLQKIATQELLMLMGLNRQRSNTLMTLCHIED